ncbi:hypothetical protein BU15DRAFT_88909 [Melanogaster broomeanus]|nr:hypothetical protein BU15DRAFT_88909 [Melanogaster broomeanus]
MLETFSRTVRNYVPTSIPVPTAAPSPPRVSRPVSFGSFMGVNLGASSSPSAGDRHRSRALGSQPSSRGKGLHSDSSEVDVTIFGSEDEDVAPENPRLTAYPTVGEGDSILWSRWDSLAQLNSKPRRVLFLGYSSGIQMWDCTNLASVSEVLNLSGPSWGRVTFAGVLPPPSPADDGQLINLRPLIGLISKTRGQSIMIIYSLRSHEVVKRLPFRSVSSFTSSNHFTVISTTNPPTLHVLSSASFTILHTISSSSLFAYSRTSTHKPNTTNTVSLSDIDFEDNASTADDPVPIYSLSHRLLAFASRPPRPDSPHGTAALQPRTHVRASSSTFGISQADIGSAAIKVGGTVLSGMKSLGGMAYNAAAEYAKSRSGIAPYPSIAAPAKGDQRSSVISGVGNLFFSRSAPTTRSYVKVLDLAPLLNRRASSHPHVITEFVAAEHQPINGLKFTHDGISLVVGPKDGQVVRIFQIRPSPGVLRGGHVGGGGSIGRTSAIIEGMVTSPDGRWVAIGTGKRTVHIFAINPYGGQPDLRSHTDTRIWNVDKPQPLSTELTPIARLRSARAAGTDSPRSDLSVTFVSGEVPLPIGLLPPPSQIASSPSTSSGRSDRASPHPSQRQQNFKDVLLFDSSAGALSLRRITLEQRLRDSAIPFSAPIANFATSISLPGAGAAGLLSVSPPSHTPKDSKTSSGLTQQLLEAASELVGRESIVATWQLKRRQDWMEVKNVLTETGDNVRSTVSNALAHAELSTCSRAPEIVPRSIYLSHQFLFYSLGEDYHALIRRHHLDMAGDKIEVRKEVEASAYATGAPGELFVEGFSAGTRDHHGRAASSFDEPIASAMSADLEYTLSGKSPIIPMLPNGIVGSKPRSFGNPVPIRHMTANIAEGVGEGFGRIRREIHKVRSPQLGPRSDTGIAAPVPLEFDEHDEDFDDSSRGEHAGEALSRRTSAGAGGSSASISTPSTHVNPLEDDDDSEGDGDDLWRGWTEEDKLAVDEAEQFDDVVGFLDEDQTPAIQAEQRKTNRRQQW